MQKVRWLSRSLPGTAQGLAASEALGSLAPAVGASLTLTPMAWELGAVGLNWFSTKVVFILNALGLGLYLVIQCLSSATPCRFAILRKGN